MEHIYINAKSKIVKDISAVVCKFRPLDRVDAVLNIFIEEKEIEQIQTMLFTIIYGPLAGLDALLGIFLNRKKKVATEKNYLKIQTMRTCIIIYIL